MTSVIRKIRSRSRSKSRDSKRNSVEKQRPSFISDLDSENEMQSHADHLNSCSSADSGVSSIVPSAVLSSPDENVLSDDQDFVGSEISGTLAFADNATSPTISCDFKDFAYSLPWEGNHSTVINITFEVISAEVVKEGRSSHVTYTILINSSKDGVKGTQTVVQRRYSDFENLHQALRKKFSPIMSSVSFPRKMLMGNFTSETIAKRSTAFEQYLSHLFSHFEVRYSKEYMEFFVQDNFQNALKHFIENEYSLAVPFLERTIPVLEKLYGYFHPKVVHCVCCLVVCFTKLNLPNTAHSCSEMMLKCCIPESSSANEELRCAALQSAIHLSWVLSKDKAVLEKKLAEMRTNGFDVDKAKDLQQILLRTLEMKAVS